MCEPLTWFRLAAVCPTCRRRPADQYTADAVLDARSKPLEKPYKNVRCKCGTTYLIAWVALAHAEPIERPPEPGMPWAA
jgi:hypothetical protein